MKKSVQLTILVVLLAVFLAVALYFTFKPDKCLNYECWSDHMKKCDFAEYINEEPEASWQYVVKGHVGEQCKIEVTLLQAKYGNLRLTDFEGHSMDCYYPIGQATYPDEDLLLCHGLLKEDLQGIIITKLHEYIVSNLGNISDAFENVY